MSKDPSVGTVLHQGSQHGTRKITHRNDQSDGQRLDRYMSKHQERHPISLKTVLGILTSAQHIFFGVDNLIKDMRSAYNTKLLLCWFLSASNCEVPPLLYQSGHLPVLRTSHVSKRVAEACAVRTSQHELLMVFYQGKTVHHPCRPCSTSSLANFTLAST